MKSKFITLGLLFFISISSFAQEYTPSKENLKAREWFEGAQFGMFIHWGVYSILGDGEWVMNNQNIAIESYEKLPSFFNPTEFDAQKWVKLAKDAGMKYITITTRHHDGFSMFDSEVSDYDIVDRTPYGKDIIKQLAKACRKEGIKLFFYYSLLDWHHPDYFPKGKTGKGIPDRSTEGNWEDYIAFMKAQLTELLTNYGKIGGIWFDGHWDKKDANWHYDEIYKLIHELQPQALIGNNHHMAPIEGEDFQMFERDLPGKNTTGHGTSESDISNLPKEICKTINGSWGFDIQDRNHKSGKQLIQDLTKAAGYGANLLLNVGPMPNGKIQKEHQKALIKVGDWLSKYGETIYATTEGPIDPTESFVSTQKGNNTYLHLLDLDKSVFFIKGFTRDIQSAQFFDSKHKVKINKTKYGTFIEVPESEKGEISTIIKLTLK